MSYTRSDSTRPASSTVVSVRVPPGWSMRAPGAALADELFTAPSLGGELLPAAETLNHLRVAGAPAFLDQLSAVEQKIERGVRQSTCCAGCRRTGRRMWENPRSRPLLVSS